jgi:predicted nucleic acid-binding protein
MVIDASVALAWCFRDEATPATFALLDAVERDGAVVPALWSLETANILLVAQRRGRLNGAEVAESLALLSGLPIRREPAPDHEILDRTIALAAATSLSMYDATYLELAARLDMPLASLDRALRVAAAASGVAVLPR